MRKCMYGWCNGGFNFKTKLSGRQIEEMSAMLEGCNITRPSEIHRTIRSLKNLKHWKGSEFRALLLYIGIIVLKDFLSKEAYEHFLMLQIAITILSCRSYLNHLEVADILIKRYIQTYITLYGRDSISSNVHNLCHVVDDVKRFGPLIDISSYPFENFLGHLMQFIRTGYKPLAQICKRLNEISSSNYYKINEKRQSIVLVNDTPWIEEYGVPRNVKIFKKLIFSTYFYVDNKMKNKWFLTNNSTIVAMEIVVNINGKYKIYGRPLINAYDFFENPLKSSNIDIYASTGDLNNPKWFDFTDVKCKLFSLKYRNEIIFMPLLHTLDIMAEHKNKF